MNNVYNILLYAVVYQNNDYYIIDYTCQLASMNPNINVVLLNTQEQFLNYINQNNLEYTKEQEITDQWQIQQ